MRKLVRIIAIIASIAIVLSIVAALLLRVFVHGKNLGDIIADRMSEQLRGRFSIDSAEWPLSHFHTLLFGGWLPVDVENFDVFDEDGQRVIHAATASLKIDTSGLLFGGTEIRLKNVNIGPESSAIIRSVPNPNPSYEFNERAISLILSFQTKTDQKATAGVRAQTGVLLEFEDFTVVDTDIVLDFGSFKAELFDVSSSGFLRMLGEDPLTPSLFYELDIKAKSASITSPFSLDLIDVNVGRLAQLPEAWPEITVPRDLSFNLTAEALAGGDISVQGSLTDFWLDRFLGTYDLSVGIGNARGLIEEFTNGFVGGETIAANITIKGAVLGPVISAEAQDINFFPGPVHSENSLSLHTDTAKLVFDINKDAGKLLPLTLEGADGAARVSADVGLYPTAIDLEFEITKGFQLKPWLPKEFIRVAGGSVLTGRSRATGDLKVQKINPIALRLGSTKITGALEHRGTRLSASRDFTIERGKTSIAKINGFLDWGLRTYALRFGELTSNDASTFFRRLDAPVLASKILGKGQISGTFDDPKEMRGDAQLQLAGVPILGTIDAALGLRGLTLELLQANSTLWQGAVRAKGELIFENKPRMNGIEVIAEGIDLAKVPNYSDDISGTVDLRLFADGLLSRSNLDFLAKLKNLDVNGDKFDRAEIQITQKKNKTSTLTVDMAREDGGGALIEAKTEKNALSGFARISEFPIATLFNLGGMGDTQLGTNIGGKLKADMTLGGTKTSPLIDGEASLIGGWVQNIFFGNAAINIDSSASSSTDNKGPVKVAATFFQDKISIDAFVTPALPLSTKASVSLRRVELDLLRPELAEKYGVRGWVSGTVDWTGNLIGIGKTSTVATFNEAVFMIDREDAEGRPAPFVVKNKTPIKIAWDGKTMTMTETALLTGPLGDFKLSGTASEQALDLDAKGTIDLALLTPYLTEYFQSMAGSSTIAAHIGGTAAERYYTGSVQFKDVRVRPQGQDALVEIPKGKIELKNDQLAVTGLSVEVLDEFNQRSVLEIAGGASLSAKDGATRKKNASGSISGPFANLVPTSWAITMEGTLAGKMLLVAAPQLFSQASGSAEISVSFLGNNTTPELDGTIEFSPESAFKVTPRGVRKEIALSNGRLEFSQNLAELQEIRGTIDGEGQIVSLNGEVSFAPLSNLTFETPKLESVDLTLEARDLPFRIPGELEAQVNVPSLQIIGGENQDYEFIGRAEVVDGRYIRKWSPFLDAVRPERSSESSEPFYADYPWLANANLQIDLDTRGFVVRNNVANIEMNGTVTISGTPAKPKFEGVVRVDQGSFSFQGVRANFTRTSGTITFSRFRDFPNDTPYLQLVSESDFRDISGQDHVVTLSLEGSIANLDWDLSTNSGLTRGQTFTLIVAGRTTEETRRALGDQAVGARPGGFTAVSTASEEGAFVAVDQVVKDLAGDFFSLLIEDPIKNFTSLDVARLEVGTASIGFRGEKNFTKSLRVIGEVDRSFLRGWSWDVRGEYRLTDSISLDGEVLQKNFDDDAEEDETNLRAKFSWRRVLLP